MTDNYSGERSLKENMKILPAGGKDNARKDEGLTERIYDNLPESPPLKVEVKSPYVSMLSEKNLKIWNDQQSDFEKIRKKLEAVLSQTTGMTSLTACAHLLGMHISLKVKSIVSLVQHCLVFSSFKMHLRYIVPMAESVRL